MLHIARLYDVHSITVLVEEGEDGTVAQNGLEHLRCGIMWFGRADDHASMDVAEQLLNFEIGNSLRELHHPMGDVQFFGHRLNGALGMSCPDVHHAGAIGQFSPRVERFEGFEDRLMEGRAQREEGTGYKATTLFVGHGGCVGWSMEWSAASNPNWNSAVRAPSLGFWSNAPWK